MGIYYKFANYTKKEILDFESAKLREITGNKFDQELLAHYLGMNVYELCEYKFVGDETGGWDETAEFKDITCDVLYDMFEDGFIPSQWQFGWIYSKFKDADRLSEFAEWIKKFKEKKT